MQLQGYPQRLGCRYRVTHKEYNFRDSVVGTKNKTDTGLPTKNITSETGLSAQRIIQRQGYPQRIIQIQGYLQRIIQIKG